MVNASKGSTKDKENLLANAGAVASATKPSVCTQTKLASSLAMMRRNCAAKRFDQILRLDFCLVQSTRSNNHDHLSARLVLRRVQEVLILSVHRRSCKQNENFRENFLSELKND